MTNIRPIWTPQDSVDTAQQFHMELHNAERGARYCVRCDKSQLVVKVDSDGVCRTCKRRSRIASRLFSRSRFRRARIMDALAVALLVVLLTLLGWLYAIAWAPSAKAVLDDHATVAGVYGLGQGIVEESGLSHYQAGQVIGLSVAEICPRHTGLMRLVAATSGAWA